MKQKSIELRNSISPIYTKHHVEAFRQDGKLSFGISQTELNELIQNIEVGVTQRPLETPSKSFEIHSSTLGYCGDINLIEGDGEYMELHILIFPFARHARIGKDALNMAIQQFKQEGLLLEAVIRSENKYKNTIVKYLQEFGFKEYEHFETTVVYR